MNFLIGGVFTVWKGEPGKLKKCGSFHNLVTNYGMNTMVTKSLKDLTTTIHVGSGNTAPANTDIALVTEIANTTNTTLSTIPYDSALGYVAVRRMFSFAAGAAEGTLAELGLSDGTSLFNRQLFKDYADNPTTITVNSTEVLEILCEIRIEVPPVNTKSDSAVATINGQDFNFNFGSTVAFFDGTYNANFVETLLTVFSDYRQWSFRETLLDYSNTCVFDNVSKSYVSSVLMDAYVTDSFELNFNIFRYAGTAIRIDALLMQIQTMHSTANYFSTALEIGLSPGYNMYAETEWQASHVYTAGDKFISALGDSFIYEVTTGGTSHTVAPTWPTTIAGTVTDGGGVVYECVAPLLQLTDAEALEMNVKITWGRA